MTKIYISPSTQPANRYSAGGTNEMEQMHRVGAALAPKLRAMGLDVKLSQFKREGQFVNAGKESNAWGADLHLAIHSDAGSPSRLGSHTIHYPNSAAGKRFAKAIQARVAELTPWEDYGTVGRTDLYELKRTNAVAALVEVSFHDKAKSAQWIIDNTDAIAEALAHGVADYLGIKRTAASAPAPTVKAGYPAVIVDGVLGVETLKAFARYLKVPCPIRAREWTKDEMFVKAFQKWLGRGQTGQWTRSHTRSLQTKLGVTEDGLFGPNTVRALQRFINRRIADGSLK